MSTTKNSLRCVKKKMVMMMMMRGGRVFRVFFSKDEISWRNCSRRKERTKETKPYNSQTLHHHRREFWVSFCFVSFCLLASIVHFSVPNVWSRRREDEDEEEEAHRVSLSASRLENQTFFCFHFRTLAIQHNTTQRSQRTQPIVSSDVVFTTSWVFFFVCFVLL